MIKFINGSKKLITTKIGADFFSENVSQLTSFLPLAVPLGLQSYYYVDLTGTMDDAQAAINNNFITSTGAKLAIYLPVQLDNYIDYLNWIVKSFKNLDFIQMDQEKMPITKEEYVARCHVAMNMYPMIPFSWNCGLLTKNDDGSKAMNALILQQTGAIRGRQYQHLSDYCTFTTDQAMNLSMIQSYSNSFLPQIAIDFKTATGLTKQEILQWSEYLNDNLLSPAVLNLAIGGMSLFTLQNTENYGGLYRQSITNLINVRQGIAVPTPSYDSLKRTVPCFKYKNTIPLTLTGLDGCSAQGFSDGKNSFAILLTNPTGTEEAISVSDISIPKKKVTDSLINDCGWADTLEADINNSIFTDTKIPIKTNSTNLITFNAQ